MSKIIHPVWQMTRKDSKINVFKSNFIKSGLCKHFRDFRPPDEKVTHEQAALNSEAECDNVG